MICAFQAQNLEFKLPQSCPENGNLFLEVAAVLDNSEEQISKFLEIKVL